MEQQQQQQQQILTHDSETKEERPVFWSNATKYVGGGRDGPFVEEIAYIMVTLHRTGA